MTSYENNILSIQKIDGNFDCNCEVLSKKSQEKLKEIKEILKIPHIFFGFNF